MVNYGRKKAKQMVFAHDMTIKVGAVMLVPLVSFMVRTIWKTSKKQDIQTRILDSERKIRDYRSGFLGSLRNREKIKAEQEVIEGLMSMLGKL